MASATPEKLKSLTNGARSAAPATGKAASGKPVAKPVPVKAGTNGKAPSVKPVMPDAPEFAQRQLLAALRSMAKGDFSVRVSTALPGIDADIAEAFNDVVSLNARMVKEFERISDVVGIDGRIKERAELTQVPGSWADYMRSLNSLNSLIDDRDPRA